LGEAFCVVDLQGQLRRLFQVGLGGVPAVLLADAEGESDGLTFGKPALPERDVLDELTRSLTVDLQIASRFGGHRAEFGPIRIAPGEDEEDQVVLYLHALL